MGTSRPHTSMTDWASRSCSSSRLRSPCRPRRCPWPCDRSSRVRSRLRIHSRPRRRGKRGDNDKRRRWSSANNIRPRHSPRPSGSCWHSRICWRVGPSGIPNSSANKRRGRRPDNPNRWCTRRRYIPGCTPPLGASSSDRSRRPCSPHRCDSGRRGRCPSTSHRERPVLGRPCRSRRWRGGARGRERPWEGRCSNMTARRHRDKGANDA
jgi:hypothetical protein